VVAADFLDLPFTTVDIIPNFQAHYFGKVEQEPITFEWYPKEQAVLDALDKNIICSFAGMAAQARHRGRVEWKYGGRDFRDALNLALVRHSEGSFEEVEAYIRYMWVRTHEFLKKHDHWAAVEGVAHALLRCTRLTQDEVKQAIREAVSPIWREKGLERSEVEKLRAPYSDDGENQDTRLWQYMIRRSLRTLWPRPPAQAGGMLAPSRAWRHSKNNGPRHVRPPRQGPLRLGGATAVTV